MKKYIVIFSLIMLAIFAVGLINTSNCSAWEKHRQELTDNQKLDEANKIYKKAIKSIEAGDRMHEPQRAVQCYKDAESYLRRAAFALKNLGIEYDIDVTKEIAYCEKLERDAHSRQGMARREK